MALQHPGALLRAGLRSMAQYLPQGTGGSSSSSVANSSSVAADFSPRVVQYLTTVVPVGTLGLKNHRELQTIAQSLDALLRGEILLAGDTLMQRFKSVELAAQSQSWSVAQHLELVPTLTVSATGGKEMKAATREELTARRLQRDNRPGGGRRSESAKASRRPG